MECNELEHYLADYLEGELDAARTDELLAHVEQCSVCRAEFQAYEKQDDLLVRYYKREAERVERSKNPLRTGAVSGTEMEQPGSRFRWIGWAAAAVILIAVGFGGWSIYRHVVPVGHAALATVDAVQGRAFLVGPNRFLEPGTTIHQAEDIKVARGGYIALRLPDGNAIEAREGTKLTLLDFPDRLEVSLNGGQVWTHLNTEPAKSFTVRTSHLTATAAAAVCNVEDTLDRSNVLVARGTVSVESGGTRTVVNKGGTFCSRPGAVEGSVRAAVAWSRRPKDLDVFASADHVADSRTPPLQVEAASTPRKAAVPRETTTLSTTSVLGSTSSTTSTTAERDLVDFLPADMLYILDFRDWYGLVNDFSASDYATLLQRPEISQWWDAVNGPEYLEKLQTNTRILDVLEIAKQIDGEMVVAVDGQGRLLLLADGGANTDAIRSRLEVLRDQVAQTADSGTNPAADFDEHVQLVGDCLIVATNVEMMNDTARRLLEGDPTGFADGPFYRKIMGDVDNPRFLIAANLAGQVHRWTDTLGSDAESSREIAALFDLWGLPSVDYLLVSPSFAGRGMKQAARLAFVEGGRYGAMDWLAEPAPMRGLEFFSPDIHFFASAIIRSPSQMFLDYLAFLEATRPQTDFQEAVDFVARNQEFFESFGGEIALGVDSPILPIPNIKIAVEITDEAAFRAGIDKLMNAIQSELEAHEQVSVLQTTTHKNRTVYTLAIEGVPFDPSWAFVDDYFIAGPGPQFVRDSIDVHESQRSIANDSRLISLMPDQVETNFSLLVYQDIARSVPEVLKKAVGSAATDPVAGSWIPNLDFLQDYRAPGIAYAYAYPTYIDAYLSTPTGIDMNLGMAVPLVANWLLPRTGLGVAISKTAEAQVALEEVQAAVEKFQAANLRLPRDLSELANPPGLYIDRLPLDPFGLIAGDTLRFAEGPGPDQITIYSIGPDGVDDGGTIEYSIADQFDGPGDIILRIPATEPESGAPTSGGSDASDESQTQDSPP